MAPDRPDKVKKRKRHTDDLSKPSKRVAVQVDKEVKVSVQEPEDWAPVVVSANGISIPKIPLEPWTKPRKEGGESQPRRTLISNTELALRSSAHPKLDYAAREEEEGAVEPFRKHYVGIYDPATGNLEVIEARKMVIRGAVRAQQSAKPRATLETDKDARDAVTREYGSRKAKKALASITENAITPDMGARTEEKTKLIKPDSVTKAMMGRIDKTTAKMSTQDELAKAADAVKPRPKRNPDATDVQDVYTIDNLIGDGIMKLVPVRQWMEALKANENVTTSSKYVASRLGLSRISSNVEKLKILRYMYLLIEIYTQSKPARDERRLPKREDMKTIAGDMPEAVVGDVKRRFAEGPVIPKFKANLLITHLCALACLVDNFVVDTYDLQLDLRLEMKEMSQYFREIGAKIGTLTEVERKKQKLEKAAAAQHRVAKLKLPLEFPQLATGRARKA